MIATATATIRIKTTIRIFLVFISLYIISPFSEQGSCSRVVDEKILTSYSRELKPGGQLLGTQFLIDFKGGQ